MAESCLSESLQIFYVPSASLNSPWTWREPVPWLCQLRGHETAFKSWQAEQDVLPLSLSQTYVLPRDKKLFLLEVRMAAGSFHWFSFSFPFHFIFFQSLRCLVTVPCPCTRWRTGSKARDYLFKERLDVSALHFSSPPDTYMSLRISNHGTSYSPRLPGFSRSFNTLNSICKITPCWNCAVWVTYR